MIEMNKPSIAWRHYAGIFLLCAATLLLELSLTRVLSVTLWYHFGFLVISTALLGFGASGVTLALWRRLREDASLDLSLSVLALVFGVTTVASFWMLQRIPFDPFSLLSDPNQIWLMPLYFLTVAVPFFFAGLALGLLLTRGSAHINRLYAFDLLGAGVGCGAIALVLPAFGGAGSVVIAAGIGLVASLVFGWKESRPVSVAAGAAAIACLMLALAAETALPITITANKFHPGSKPTYSAWNIFSRIEFFDLPRSASRKRPEVGFVIDAGTAYSGLPNLNPDFRQVMATMTDPMDFDSQVAYLGRVKPNILIIGSGAGGQVLDAVQFGAGRISAIEINPIINDTITRRYKDRWGGLFDQPNVNLVTAEARSYVRRSRNTYDAIISEHTISNSAIASGALALTENYVLTREAFEDYYNHLSPDGVIFFTRPQTQIPRLFATGREVLEAHGVKDLRAHFYAFGGRPGADAKTTRFNRFSAGLLIKKSAFTPEQVQKINAFLGTSKPDGDVAALYTPLDAPTGTLFQRLLTDTDLTAIYDKSASILAPATDNQPFFNEHVRWSSIGPRTILDVFKQGRMGRMALEDRPVAEVTLIVLLFQTVVIAGILIVSPLLLFKREDLQASGRGAILVYFAALGLGFIFIEVVFLQHFILFLGQPIYTFAVVLAGLLVFTGLGSILSDRLGPRPRDRLGRIIPALLGLLAVTAALTPAVFQAELGLPLAARVAISLAVIAPLGVLLGMPFPTGMRIVSEEAPGLTPWAWGINGFFTVIGTILALILAMILGFSAVLMLAGVCYLLAWLALGISGISDRGRDAHN
jgi:MFS family permease